MELNEFVATTLKQIIEGVSEAQLGMKDRALVNPGIMGEVAGTSIPLAKGFGKSSVQFIEFDVAVSATSTSEGGGSAGIAVLGFNVKGGGGGSTQEASLNRIKFSVPVAFPNPEAFPAKQP